MLSMINPDSLTRFDSHAKFSTSNMHHQAGGAPMVHETYYEHAEMEKPMKGAKSSLLTFPHTKTQTNFYPGPLG